MELQDIFEEKCWFTKTGQVNLDVWSMCIVLWWNVRFSLYDKWRCFLTSGVFLKTFCFYIPIL